MLYSDLIKQYDKVKQCGNKIIVVTPGNTVIGYTIIDYRNYEPLTLKDKIYTDINNCMGLMALLLTTHMIFYTGRLMRISY